MPDADAVALLTTPAAMNNNEHYLRAVAQLASQRVVTVRETVRSSAGLALLAQGTRLPPNIDEVLRKFVLPTPIYKYLEVLDGVDIRTLEAEVMMLSASHPLGHMLVKALGGRSPALLEPLRYMPWPQAACFQLTLLRQVQPKLFEHSILMMMVAVYLGLKVQMTVYELGRLAAAALLHDVGMLFLPAEFISHSRTLSVQERQLLVAHSQLAVMVVRGCGVYGLEVEDAILEHHERLDGSGYPKGLQAEDISTMGRVLMVAEVVSAFYGKYHDMPAHRLQLVLRMNHARLPQDLLDHIYPMVAGYRKLVISGKVDTRSAAMQVFDEMERVVCVFQLWNECNHRLPKRWQGMVGGRAGVFIETRLMALEKSLTDAGVHPSQRVSSWQNLTAQDASHLLEQLLILREALWQVRSVVNACTRRWPKVEAPESRVDWALFQWVRSCKLLLGEPMSESMAQAAGSGNTAGPREK